MGTLEEAGLGEVDGADAGDDGLVEERLSQRTVGPGQQAEQGFALVEVLGHQVRTEVPDDAVLVSGGQQLDEAEGEADRLLALNPQHDARLVRGPWPTTPGVHHPPDALHLEVGVQREGLTVVLEPGEEVLAVGAGAEHLGAGEVDRRQRRPPEVRRGEHSSGETAIEPARGEVDGVALGHDVA
jgi:hypothetical protein